MKKILTIIFIFFGLSTYSQTILAPPNTTEQELLLSYKSIKKFIGDTNLTVILQPYAPLRYGMQGLTEQLNKNLYVVSISTYITNEKIRKWIILHEIGHVIDFHRGRLNQHPPMWENCPIDNNIDWVSRPWEQAAEDWALIMWSVLVKDETPPYLFTVE